jgi:hypothetical protein
LRIWSSTDKPVDVVGLWEACLSLLRRLRLVHVLDEVGLRERTTDAVEAGPVFIPCRHLDSPNRAGRLPTALRSREGIVTVFPFPDLGWR